MDPLTGTPELEPSQRPDTDEKDHKHTAEGGSRSPNPAGRRHRTREEGTAAPLPEAQLANASISGPKRKPRTRRGARDVAEPAGDSKMIPSEEKNGSTGKACA